MRELSMKSSDGMGLYPKPKLTEIQNYKWVWIMEVRKMEKGITLKKKKKFESRDRSAESFVF